MGRTHNLYETITRASREGARYAAAPTGASCGNASPSASAAQAVGDTALSARSLDPALKTNYTFQQNVILKPGGNPTEIEALISFSYPAAPAIPFTSLDATISTQVQMRQENQ